MQTTRQSPPGAKQANRRPTPGAEKANEKGDLSVSYDNLGDVTLLLGQTEAALDWYEKGLAVSQRLADADPKNAEAQRDLLVNFYKFGMVSEKLEDYSAAIGWYEKALAVAAKFKRPEFFANQVKTLKNRINTRQSAEKAIADIEFAFQQPLAQIPELLALRTKTLLKRGQPAEAVKTAERFAAWAEKQDEKTRDGERYNAACVFALCAAALEKDREKLVEQSIALLQKAKSGGYFTNQRIAHIKQDSDFHGIREHKKFAAFLIELGSPP